MTPSVSIIMPSYNCKEYISYSIESVREQTYTDWELLIVDDHSTDGTVDLLKEWEKADGRIRIFYQTVNEGAAVARNIALAHARGRYIAFLDSDDRWKKDKLEAQLAYMMDNKYAFTFTAYEWIDQKGEYLNKYIRAPKRVDYQTMLKNTIVGCLTVLIDRDQVGDFRMPNIRTRQDLATWLMILKRGFRAFGLNEILAEYRVGNESISKNKWKAAKNNWHVYRQIEQLNFLQSSWYFSHYAYNAIRKRL
ncbi:MULTISPECIES: teichuronic acid biosynthesis protein TuaG [unclassified Bacillus (in: firmicutes)]|uniref:teichuronic acid biosynthesis protein TuaG n=1 Tax=unclassified Bacillus (in: firmicutes) TaxID=185979 RepID=UPI0004E0C8E2|nr:MULTISPECIES: glycosyltransferase family 2 protein [unclassified Bacillus (in: firmicutes)]REB73977.1 glycosyltransferase family 2 protein [Cutibacterium acnes]